VIIFYFSDVFWATVAFGVGVIAGGGISFFLPLKASVSLDLAF